MDKCDGEGGVVVLSVKRWDRRNREVLVDSATACHDSQDHYKDYITAPQGKAEKKNIWHWDRN